MKAGSTRTAWAVTAAVIALSAFLGCNRSLAALRTRTERQITAADAYGNCVADDCQELVNTARNLMTVARWYLPKDEPALARLESSCVRMEQAGADAAVRRDAAADIRDDAEAVIQTLEATGAVTETDRSDLAGFRTLIKAGLHRMETDGYNTSAEAFNDVESAFPANLLGVLVGPLTTFDF